MDDQNDETDTSTSDIVNEESFNGKISSAVEEVDDLLDEDSDLDESMNNLKSSIHHKKQKKSIFTSLKEAHNTDKSDSVKEDIFCFSMYN